ncbi:DUF1810 domain-containing protein [Arvimicrobium flavum]|uniref:DUF1810 domain-containing protein n=1 Tax=Arvimicrobium flavum TaxID=3393320 RepID=UPI00237A1BAB|nr:DUF1810 domain-containing protein [Mesorhizobium shangrilense]
MSSDPFDLQRFFDAQAPVIETVRRELAAGRKASHWMWFVFPQIAGLGFSAMSQRYAIASLAEARAYLDHPVLGARLRECVELALRHRARTAHEIFGSPDDMKFRSCLTLFDKGVPGDVFAEALATFFEGERDEATLRTVQSWS